MARASLNLLYSGKLDYYVTWGEILEGTGRIDITNSELRRLSELFGIKVLFQKREIDDLSKLSLSDRLEFRPVCSYQEVESTQHLTVKEYSEDKILFCNIAWMKNYRGVTEEDRPKNGGAYVAQTDYAHECYNFQDFDGKCYGFVRMRGNLSLEAHFQGARKSDSFVENALVIWVATNDRDENRIVGWYRRAKIYRSEQAKCVNTDENYYQSYRIKANFEDVFLVPELERNFKIGRASRDGTGRGMGRSNIWYAESDYARTDLIPRVKEYISEVEGELGQVVERIEEAEIPKELEVVKDRFHETELRDSSEVDKVVSSEKEKLVETSSELKVKIGKETGKKEDMDSKRAITNPYSYRKKSSLRRDLDKISMVITRVVIFPIIAPLVLGLINPLLWLISVPVLCTYGAISLSKKPNIARALDREDMIVLVNREENDTALIKRGVSFRTLVFNFMEPWYRGDLVNGIKIMLLSVLTLGLAGIYYFAKYNTIYLKLLLKYGYEPYDANQEHKLKKFLRVNPAKDQNIQGESLP